MSKAVKEREMKTQQGNLKSNFYPHYESMPKNLLRFQRALEQISATQKAKMVSMSL